MTRKERRSAREKRRGNGSPLDDWNGASVGSVLLATSPPDEREEERAEMLDGIERMATRAGITRQGRQLRCTRSNNVCGAGIEDNDRLALMYDGALQNRTGPPQGDPLLGPGGTERGRW